MSAKLKVKKIISDTSESKHLITFLNSLGVRSNIELYLCDKYAYLNSDIIIPILSVDIKWFIKNSESPTHYLRIKSQIFINKYGITKLLAQSKEAIAFKLQDYLYELLYRVESGDTVNKDNLTSRDELIKSLLPELSDKLSNAKEETNTLRCDYAITEEENIRLQNQVDTLTHEKKLLLDDYNEMKDIASKLAAYVKTKKNAPVEAFDEDLDEASDTVSDLELVEKAIESKSKLKKINKKEDIPIPTIKEAKYIIPNKPYSLLRFSTQSMESSDEPEYKWQLVNTEISDEFKAKSADYLLDEDPECKPEGDFIWYQDLQLTEEKKKAIALFLSLKEAYSYSVINKLL